MSILNDAQLEQLNSSIYLYLKKNFPSSADQFYKECKNLNISENDLNSNLESSKLEMKWGFVLKMQKQKIELENQIKQLQEQIEKYESGDIKKERKTALHFIPKTIIRTLLGHKAQVTCVAFHSKIPILASASEDCSIRLWDYETGEQENFLQGHLGIVNCIEFNKEGNLLASCGNDLSIRLWSSESGWQMTRMMYGHEHIVSCIRFIGPNDKRIASASRDTTIKIWEVSSGFCLLTLRGHDSWVRSIDINAEGTQIISGSDDRSIRIWNISNGQCTKVIQAHDHNIEFVYYSPSNVNETFRESHGISIPKLINQDGEKEPDAQFILSGSRDKLLKIWNANTGELVCTMKGHNNWVRDSYWHPNGKHILSCSDDKSIKIWDIRTGLVVRTIENAQNHFISTIKICKLQSNLLATGCVDNQVCIWKCN